MIGKFQSYKEKEMRNEQRKIVTVGHNELDYSIRQYQFLTPFEPLLLQKGWSLTNSRANLGKWQFTLSKIISTGVEYFDLGFNMNSMLLKNICRISFEELRQMNLESNFISNIEALSYLKAPKLQQIGLQNNCIYSLKPLIKLCHSRELSDINIEGNFQSLNQLKRVVNRLDKVVRLENVDLTVLEDRRHLQKKFNNWVYRRRTSNRKQMLQLKIEAHQNRIQVPLGLMLYGICIELESRNDQSEPYYSFREDPAAAIEQQDLNVQAQYGQDPQEIEGVFQQPQRQYQLANGEQHW